MAFNNVISKANKKELSNKGMKEKEAEKAMDRRYNCAQSLVLPFLEKYGIDEEVGLRFSSVFGSGMGRMQETCGALTGGFMVLGLEYGFVNANDNKQRELLLMKTKEFIGNFKSEFGTTKCKDLLKYNIDTEEGLRMHKEENERELICKLCVIYSARLLEEMISKDK